MKTATWFIGQFDDYHEIREDAFLGSHGKKFKAVELGCFPVEDYSYNRYFGLFYTGRRPSFDEILKAVKKKVVLSDKEVETRDITLESLKYEIKQSLKV